MTECDIYKDAERRHRFCCHGTCGPVVVRSSGGDGSSGASLFLLWLFAGREVGAEAASAKLRRRRCLRAMAFRRNLREILNKMLPARMEIQVSRSQLTRFFSRAEKKRSIVVEKKSQRPLERLWPSLPAFRWLWKGVGQEYQQI